MKVGVHQGSVFSPLLFIIVLEALSREFRAGVPWDLYADDLVIIADSLEECVRRLLIWKEVMEKKGLRVNAGKTKVMICGTGLDLLQSSGAYPCAVCRTGVGNNSIYCNGCKLWVHKKCSGLQRLTPNPDYTGVHGAWKMLALMTADHRVKSRSDLISLRWCPCENEVGFIGTVLELSGTHFSGTFWDNHLIPINPNIGIIWY